jgi:hypothetical protein
MWEVLDSDLSTEIRYADRGFPQSFQADDGIVLQIKTQTEGHL